MALKIYLCSGLGNKLFQYAYVKNIWCRRKSS